MSHEKVEKTETAPKEKNYLTTGDKGDKVKELQLKLIALGYLDEKYALTGNGFGNFGPKTLEALRKFQKDAQALYKEDADIESAVDGKYGPKSIKSMDKMLANREKLSEEKKAELDENLKNIADKKPLKLKDVPDPEAVRELQQQLNFLRAELGLKGEPLSITGEMNEKTVTALKAAQKYLKEHGADGIEITGKLDQKTSRVLQDMVNKKKNAHSMATQLSGQVGLVFTQLDSDHDNAIGLNELDKLADGKDNANQLYAAFRKFVNENDQAKNGVKDNKLDVQEFAAAAQDPKNQDFLKLLVSMVDTQGPEAAPTVTGGASTVSGGKGPER